MNRYANIPTDELVEKWEAERDRLMSLPGSTIADCGDLIAMRDELDRRDYGRPQRPEVDFEKYITD